MDVELEHIPQQVGSAILDVSDGKILKATGDLLTLSDAESTCSTIYRMLRDTSKCLRNEPMRRISISYTEHSFIATLTDSHLYIIKVQGAT